VGPRHSREEILREALDAALDEGISGVTFGRLAKRLGISDRMVVYYFPTKAELLGNVMLAMGARLQGLLEDAFTVPAADHLALAGAAWPVLAQPDNDALFAVFFECNGLAAAGVEPYRTVVPQLVELWVTWLEGFLPGPHRRRRRQAEAAVALVDGLLLLRQLLGPAAADHAAAELGLRSS
jgi:AcrR family transcriptional regulator